MNEIFWTIWNNIITELCSTPIKTVMGIITTILAIITFVYMCPLGMKIKRFFTNKQFYPRKKSPDLNQPIDMGRNKESTKETSSLVDLIRDMVFETKELSKNKDYIGFQKWFILNFSDPIKKEIEKITGEKPEIEDEKDMFKWFPVRYIIKHLASSTLMELFILYRGNNISSGVIKEWAMGNDDYSDISFRLEDKTFTKEQLVNFIIDRYNKRNPS